MPRWWAVLLLTAPLTAPVVEAQSLVERAVPSSLVFDVSHPGGQLPAPSIALASALSAVLPGAGQYALGQDRAWAYLALEAAGWFAWINRRGAGNDARAAYRDYAWEVGRVQSSARTDGDFDYYETMSKWDRSGAFDSDPGAAGLQPEVDPSTFNGSIWALATRLFPEPAVDPDPAPRAEALDYYRERAYGSSFLWNWSIAPDGSRSTFGGLIEESDARFRQATNVLGLILANHVVSSVDAFVSARSRAELALEPGRSNGAASLDLRLSISVR